MGRRHAVLIGRTATPATRPQPGRPRPAGTPAKVIPTDLAEAVAVLDEIFGNPTDLPLGEHTVDTAGQTLATFAIFNLAGLQFCPVRDIGRLQL